MTLRSIAMFAVLGVLTVSLTGCATQNARIADQSIADMIKADLEATSGPEGPFEVNVYVTKGEVLLDGSVPSNSAKEEAMDIASAQEGVKEVKSFLLVTQP